MKSNYSPKYIYTLNFEEKEKGKRKFHKMPSMEVFKKIPESLELQSTFKDHIKKNSSVLLVGQKVNEKYSFYTGLVKIKNNWFYGDHLNKGKKSLCIVKFENDWSSFQIHYFNNWYIDNPKERMNFCFDYVSEIGE